MKKTYVMAAGLGVICPATGRVLLAAHRFKPGFERQLRNSGWTYAHKLWRTNEDTTSGFASEPLPEQIPDGEVLRVFVLIDRVTRDIEHVHWYDSKRAAQKHFEYHGYKIVDFKLEDNLIEVVKKLMRS